jgi:hypothetical protein
VEVEMASEAANQSWSAWSDDHGSVSAAPTWIGDRIPVGASDNATVIDCDRCTVRGIGCGDCVVTVLLGGPPHGVELDEVERRAIDILAEAGLVPPLRMVEIEPSHGNELHRGSGPL